MYHKGVNLCKGRGLEKALYPLTGEGAPCPCLYCGKVGRRARFRRRPRSSVLSMFSNSNFVPRAASPVPSVSFFPVRRPSFPCGVLCSRAARRVPPCIISFCPAAKNNPCIFLPRKKKQKAASMSTRVPPSKTTRVFSSPEKRNKRRLQRKPRIPAGLFVLFEVHELCVRFFAYERVYWHVHLVEYDRVALDFVNRGVCRDPY